MTCKAITTSLPGGLPETTAISTPHLDRWRPIITGRLTEETELPPAEVLPALRAEAAAIAAPALAKFNVTAAQVVAGSWPQPPANVRVFMAGLAEELSRGGYPPAVIREAVSEARRSLKWPPAIAELIELCESHAAPILALPRQLDRIEAEHKRREAVREARAASEARTARLKHLYGPDAPTDDHFQAAANALRRWRWGGRADADDLTKHWSAALAAGEPWAARVCHLAALHSYALGNGFAPDIAAELLALLPQDAAKSLA